ncbi:hypothetical protein HDU67_004423 [Dinochytrium kinnereticum]|nr:hypothetical protein HDU67_004423 [Dinochytrium kinnereticum]
MKASRMTPSSRPRTGSTTSLTSFRRVELPGRTLCRCRVGVRRGRERGPESGPGILGGLAADDDIADSTPAWTSRLCSTLSPTKFSPVVLRSTRWPGAIVVAYNDKFANIYVGDGHREQPVFIPPPLPEIQKEFVLVVKGEDEEDEERVREVELVEGRDPSVEEEKAFEESRRSKEGEGKEEEEGEEGEGSEGGEEEED